MTAGSLRMRLLTAAGLSILVALVMIGLLIVRVFDQHGRQRLAADLGHQLDQLAALATPGAAGGLKIDGEMTDPRFDQPLGGLYWQVNKEGAAVARSRSLWDASLAFPSVRHETGAIELSEISGPGGAALLAASRDVALKTNAGQSVTYRLTVASDLSELEAGRRGLVKTLAAGLTLAFAGLLFASWLQVGFGLKPLEQIRFELLRIRTGASASIDIARLPDEVRPLAGEVNRFLDEQRDSTERARRRAGDLAHGLKTPLAAVAAEADQLMRSGQQAAADALVRHVGTMRRHVERQLAVARSRGGEATRFVSSGPVGDRIRAIVDLLERLPSDRRLSWSIEGSHDAVAAMEAEDFDEVVGNLLDNARKWSETTVVVSVLREGTRLHITVRDDGPGIPQDQTAEAVERGRRLDERVQGSGLGLSIAQAVLESYGTELRLGPASADRGLEAGFEIAAAR